MFKPRRPELLTLAVAIYVAIILNQPFWQKFVGLVDPSRFGDWPFVASAAAALVIVAYLVLLAVSLKPVLRVIVLLLLPLTAAASYFMSEYGIVIDVHMIRNVFETDAGEAGDLVTLSLVAYVVLLGFVPAILFSLVPWTEQSFGREALGKLKAAVLSAVVLAAVLLPVWGDLISLARDHRELRMTLAPVNIVSAVSAYRRQTKRKPPADSVAAYGEDARQIGFNGGRKSFFVIVVGETARADHFSLNGYEKPTTPGLASIGDLINYGQAFSCGTDTAQSVPCMFSGLGRAGFSNAKAAARENLLDILKRAGLDVVWRENQSGCKGVCARITTETLTPLKSFDDVLVDGLDARIAKLDRDTVIVLHMMGSHGPAYWKRYPEKFEVFKPACQYAQFSRCELESVTNAYDNSIRYTDHVLTRLIDVLKGAEGHGVDAGMIYMSDHGESLGENGMYLHGMPYVIAPEAQIHVPMVIWLSEAMKRSRGLEQDCLVKRGSQRAGHDNLFHSTLGVMGVASRVYDPGLDLFAPCRKPAS